MLLTISQFQSFKAFFLFSKQKFYANKYKYHLIFDRLLLIGSFYYKALSDYRQLNNCWYKNAVLPNRKYIFYYTMETLMLIVCKTISQFYSDSLVLLLTVQCKICEN